MPERVVATMTSEVLPPYSAGGAPGMTISDCTESMGIWLEKTLDCWSVMGWLSTEKELDAWSPMPWKRPLESAETPGEARVTSELMDEEMLSSGILAKRSRSTSVWPTGSASTRSPLVVVTSTTVLAEAICSVVVRAIGTKDCTSRVCVAGAMVLAATVRR